MNDQFVLSQATFLWLCFFLEGRKRRFLTDNFKKKKTRKGAFEGSTEVAPNKKAPSQQVTKCLILLEPITGLEPVTY